MAGCGRAVLRVVVTGAALLLVVSLARPAVVRATIEFNENLQLSGSVETQNLIRTPDFGDFQLIQQRNTVRLRVDWSWAKDGRAFGKFNLPFVKKADFLMLYRGVYDGVYDIAPGGNQVGQYRVDDLIGGPLDGNRIGTLRPGCSGGIECLREGKYSRLTSGGRHALKLENRLREFFTDIEFRGIPLTLRLGRQQVIWGEADQFRLMDIWNPLDVTWRFPVADTFDDFRVPLWLAKGIWDFGTVGGFSNNFLEVVYNPFDFQPGQKVAWLPRPWGLPFADPVRSGQVQAVRGIGALVSPEFDLQGTSIHKGDFNRSIEEASEVGMRLHTVTPSGLELTVNYVYGRGKWVGNSPAFNFKLESVENKLTEQVGTFSGRPVARAVVRGKFVHPYVHVFGLTANYYDGEWTQAVLRMETAFSLGQPYATSQEDKLVDVGFGLKSPVGFAKRDVWAGMIGFDRPTWIRWLNKSNTFFISSQFFWVNLPGKNVEKLRGFSSAKLQPYFTPDANDAQLGNFNSTGGMGVWDSGGFAGQTERLQDSSLPPADHYRKWSFMHTFTMTTFYRGGTIVPQLVTLFDPINLWSMAAFELKYFYTNHMFFTVQERIFVPFRKEINDPWFVGRFGRRSETGMRVTYQF